MGDEEKTGHTVRCEPAITSLSHQRAEYLRSANSPFIKRSKENKKKS